MRTTPIKKPAPKESQKQLLHITKTAGKQLLIAGGSLLISGVVFFTLWFVHTQADVVLKKTVLHIQSAQDSPKTLIHPPSPSAWIALFSFATSFGLILEAKKWADDFGDTTVLVRAIR